MTRSIIEHIIQTMYDGRGVDSAESAFGRMESGVRRADDALRSMGNRADSFNLRTLADTFNEVTDMAGKLKAGVAAAWEMLDEGRALEQSEKRFASLAQSIGTSADVLTARLAEATQGALTQAEMAGNIGQLIEMGLVGSADKAAELADLIIRLKKPTDDATDAFGNFSAMLANQSIARLDSFGISSGAVRTRIEALMSSTQGLTREQAFLQATLDEGRKTLERTGQATGDTVSNMERLRAQLGDVKDGLIVAAYEGFQPLISQASAWVGTHGPELADALETVTTLAVTLGRGLAGFASYVGQTINRDFVEPWQRAVEGTRDLSDMGFGEMLNDLASLEIATNLLEQKLRQLGVPADQLRGVFKDLKGQYNGGFLEVGGDVAALRVYMSYLQTLLQQMSADDLPAVTVATYAYSDSLHLAREYGVEFSDAITTALPGLSAFEQYGMRANLAHARTAMEAANASAELQRQLEANQTAVAGFAAAVEAGVPYTVDLSGAILGYGESSGASVESVAALMVATGELTDGQAEAYIKTSLLKTAIDIIIEAYYGNRLSAEEAALAIKNWKTGIQNMSTAEALTQVKALNDELLSTPRDIYITYHINSVDHRGVDEEGSGSSGGSGSGGSGSSGSGGHSSGGGRHDSEFAYGGWTGNNGGVVHPGELVVPGYVLMGGMGAVGSFAQQHVPGGVRGDSGGGQTIIYQIDARGASMTEMQFQAIIERVLQEQARDLAVYRAMR